MSGIGSVNARDLTVYQLQYKNDDGDWIEHKYYVHQLMCRDDVIAIANEKSWKLDRFRCIEEEIN